MRLWKLNKKTYIDRRAVKNACHGAKTSCGILYLSRRRVCRNARASIDRLSGELLDFARLASSGFYVRGLAHN